MRSIVRPARSICVTGAVSLLCLALLGGCGAARPGRFQAFAAAGTSYTQARSGFLKQSLEAAIDRDTLELRSQRQALDGAGRVRVLDEQNAIIQERIEIIRDLVRHGEVLRLYFAALSQLATSKDDANAAAAAKRLATEMGGLTAALSQRSIGGTPITSLVGQATGFAIGAIRNKALHRHLEENAPIIARELELEEALLKAVAEEMLKDLQVLRNDMRRNKVLAPFREGDALPVEWDAERKRFLLSQVDLAKAKAAQDAAQKLRESFTSLAGGREDGSVASLESAVSHLRELVSDFARVRAASP